MSEIMETVTPLLLTVRADVGGGPQHIYHLLRHFSPRVRPVVACPPEEPYWSRYGALLGEANLIAIPARRFSLAALLRLRKEVRRRGVNLLHSHGKGAGLYGRLLVPLTGRPCVHTFHGLHIGSYGPVARTAYRMAERRLSRWTAAIIAVSPSEAEAIVQFGAAGRLVPQVIPNGVDVPARAPPASAPHEPLRVVHVTRYDHQKNPDLLLAILRDLARRGEIARFRFELLGDGLRRPAVVRQIQEEGLSPSVRVLGNVGEPARVLAGAFCCLSTSRWEGMPLALLEAMALGVPVVATRVTGNRDIVRSGVNGLLYDMDNPRAGADGLLALAKDPAWPAYGRSAWEYVRDHHSAAVMARQTEDLYVRLCRPEPSAIRPVWGA
jgi:glycosyltransferase involved in cell wall biosynthesis